MTAMKVLERLRDVVRDVVRPSIFDPHDRLRPVTELALGLVSMPFELRSYLSGGDSAGEAQFSATPQAAAGPASDAPAMVPAGYVYALDAEALREGRPLRVDIDGHALAFYRVGDTFYASDDACPHADGPLSESDQEGACVICPLHGWAFDLQDGHCTNIESARLRTYACCRVGDAVYVALDDHA